MFIFPDKKSHISGSREVQRLLVIFCKNTNILRCRVKSGQTSRFCIFQLLLMKLRRNSHSSAATSSTLFSVPVTYPPTSPTICLPMQAFVCLCHVYCCCCCCSSSSEWPFRRHCDVAFIVWLVGWLARCWPPITIIIEWATGRASERVHINLSTNSFLFIYTKIKYIYINIWLVDLLLFTFQIRGLILQTS